MIAALRLIVVALAFLAIGSNRACADNCERFMKFGIYDKFSTFSDEQHFRQVQSFFSDEQISTRQQAEQKAGAAGIDVLEILTLNLGGSTSTTSFEQWRQKLIHMSFDEARDSGLKVETVERVSTAITDTVKACLAQKGVHAYAIPATDGQNFTFVIEFVPSNPSHATTKGSFVITPASVAATASPKQLLGQPQSIGPNGVAVSFRRLPTDTVTVTYQTEDGSGSVVLDAVVTPKPTISFKVEPESIQYGQSARLIWSVKDVSSVELEGRGAVSESGSLDVSPTTDQEYRLKVVSLDGKTQSVFVKLKVAPAPAVLTSARVHFHTTNDDKDGDTHVTVNVLLGSATVAACAGTWGKFPDNSDSGWKELNVIEAARMDALLAGGRAQVIEAPNGHDEWHFNWSLELQFSDGSKKSFNWSEPNGVDHDRTTVTHGF